MQKFDLNLYLDDYFRTFDYDRLTEDEPDLDPWEYDDIELPPFRPLQEYLDNG